MLHPFSSCCFTYNNSLNCIMHYSVSLKCDYAAYVITCPSYDVIYKHPALSLNVYSSETKQVSKFLQIDFCLAFMWIKSKLRHGFCRLFSGTLCIINISIPHNVSQKWMQLQCCSNRCGCSLHKRVQELLNSSILSSNNGFRFVILTKKFRRLLRPFLENLFASNQS